jgi:Ca2+-binding RTX toxin-like protein
MATIPGSQFVATAPGQPVSVVETTTGTGLPSTVPGAFNLEVFVGSIPSVPGLAPGYQGLAILGPSGLELDLVAGAFAVTDNGGGNDTLSAFGANETVIGGTAGATLNLFGTGETARGGSGPDTINVFGNSDSVTGGTGNDTIFVGGTGDTVTAGSGNNLIDVSGAGDLITGGGGSDTINAFANFDTVNAGAGTESITGAGASDLIRLGAGSDTVNVTGASDTVTSGISAGSNQGVINLFGTGTTLTDRANNYADTVVGFDQAGGDRIHLTGTDTVAFAVANSTQVNSGADTLITLNDGSTILLKGVTHIDGSFFS